jgi:sulfotransferase
MPKQIFFQSSLPRSGSTLLQNIIGQNPDFYVTPTSGVLELLFGARANFINSPEFKAQNQDEMTTGFLNFCIGGLFNFYNSITDKSYVMDKSRGWGIHYPFLNAFYPNPKIICVIRDPKDILCSMEKNFRKNQHLDTSSVNHSKMTNTTTEKRVEEWSNSQPVGLAMERLYQMLREGLGDKVLFVKYEDLMFSPGFEMERIYDFLGLPNYQHDFDNIQQITKEDDEVYGIYGDHKIKPKLEQVVSTAEEVLGESLCRWIEQKYKWFYDYFEYK